MAHSDQYAYDIEAYRLEPPISGKIVWGARARIKRVGTGRSDDLTTLSEHFGATEDEARRRADAEAKQWISDNSRRLPHVDTDLY